MSLVPRSVSVLVLCGTLASIAFAGTITYDFTTINDPLTFQSGGGGASYAINDAGQIVGSYSNATAPPTSFGVGTGNGYLYSGGTFTTIDDPLAVQADGGTFATGLNNAGEVVGVYRNATGFYGFLDNNGAFTTISDPLGLNATQVSGINNAGQIVGTYYGGSSIRNGFLDSGGIFTSVSDPLGVKGTVPRAINESGQMVGAYFDAGNLPHGFLDTAGTFSTISIPSATESLAENINNAGQIVGWYSSGTNSYGFLDSNGVITTISDPLGVGNTYAYGINGAGQIVGDYVDASGNKYGFLATPEIQSVDNLPGGTTSAPTYLLTGTPVAYVTGTIAGLGTEEYYAFSWAGGDFSATGSIAGAGAGGSYLFSAGISGNCNTLGAETLNGTDNFAATIAIASLAPGRYCLGIDATSPNDPDFTLTFNTPVAGIPEPSGFGLLAIGFAAISALRKRNLV